MPLFAHDNLGWARYGSLNIPPEFAAILAAAAHPSSNGHMSQSHVPLAPSNTREFSQDASQGLPIGANVAPVSPVVMDGAAPGSPSPAPSPAAVVPRVPSLAPRVRLASRRVCGHCRQPGHDKRRCSILGSGRSNPNVNAINVVELLPHARIRAAPFDAPAPAHDAGEMAAERDDVAEEDSVEGDDSAASGSGSGSEADEAALEGFASEGVQWHMVYDSTQPTSDSNR